VKTNIPFHIQLLGSTRFQAGQFDTRFVEDRFMLQEEDRPHEDIAAIAATLVAHSQSRRATESISRNGNGNGAKWKWADRQ
jgi:acetyl-CoA carboxylase biotin carboxylase subunit